MPKELTLIGKGNAASTLSETEVRTILQEAFADAQLRGKRVLFIIPDGTRSAPIPMLFRAIDDLLAADVKALDFLVALGTHMPMSEEAICERLEISTADRAGKYAEMRVFNHEWDSAATFEPSAQSQAKK